MDATVVEINEGVQHLESADKLNVNITKRKLTLGGILTSVGTIAGGAVLTAFHPLIGVPIIIVGLTGIGVSIGAEKLL